MFDSSFQIKKEQRLNYRCMGAGKNVLLIHGLAANIGFWPLQALVALARQYRVIIYDLRGHGYSDMPEDGYTPADMVGDLRDLIDRLKLDKVHLVGHSFGGTVALNYAAIYPEQVESATILDTRLRSLQPANRLLDWFKGKEADPVLKALGSAIPQDEDECGIWLLEQLASPGGQHLRRKLEESPLFIPFLRFGKRSRSAEKWLHLLSSTTARQDFMADDGLSPAVLAAIRQPVLAMYGEYSPALSSLEGLKKNVRRLHACTVPKAGHFFPQTHPQPFFGQVARFLDRLDAGDQRKYDRYPLNLGIHLSAGEEAGVPAAVLNGSLKGILLVCRKEISVHSEVELWSPAGADRHEWRLRGKVVRSVSGNGSGNCLAGVELADEGESYTRWQEYLVSQNGMAGSVLPL